MDDKKYIGMDVHQASISIAVRDATGKAVVESIIENERRWPGRSGKLSGGSGPISIKSG
jgi:hypothetical protein